ncbi:MAG: S41 family peptidase [Anaerolineales bacterium]|nr:S41 family peptidase [Anaerolineales bacterium]
MKSRFTLFVALTAVALLGFNAGYLLGQSPWAPIQAFSSAPAQVDQQTIAPFWEAWTLVHNRFYQQPLNDNRLVEGAIDGMLAILDDPHTRYLSPDDEAAARARMEGEFQGIGVEVESVDGNITIVAPIDGSPAAEAGLLPGDILRAADGTSLTGMDLSEATSFVRGPKGTPVTLTIEREGELFDVEILRDVIPLLSVRSSMLEEGIAYVRLSTFGNDSTQEMKSALESLLAQNPTGLILDLRNNPGGGLNSAVSIADLFLPAGPVLIESLGSGEQEVLESTDNGIAQDIPLVVLINEGSASASEVLAGAVRDRDRGTLIGVTSFGKGTVQSWYGLSNGGGVRITFARWLTPAEEWIHQSGIEPDIVVPLPEAIPGEAQEDTQLQAAITYLQELANGETAAQN